MWKKVYCSHAYGSVVYVVHKILLKLFRRFSIDSMEIKPLESGSALRSNRTGNGSTSFTMHHRNFESPLQSFQGPSVAQRAVRAGGGFRWCMIKEIELPPFDSTVLNVGPDSRDLVAGR